MQEIEDGLRIVFGSVIPYLSDTLYHVKCRALTVTNNTPWLVDLQERGCHFWHDIHVRVKVRLLDAPD